MFPGEDNYVDFNTKPLIIYMKESSLGKIFLRKMILVKRVILRHFPQNISEPHFLYNIGPTRKPSSRENFPCRAYKNINFYFVAIYIIPLSSPEKIITLKTINYLHERIFPGEDNST